MMTGREDNIICAKSMEQKACSKNRVIGIRNNAGQNAGQKNKNSLTAGVDFE
jgi:hypothetical protein